MIRSPFWNAVIEVASQPATEASDRAATAPIIWFLGKTGSGKTSIIAELTGDPRAVVGAGFKPCTAESLIYDWPDEAPILRFLDTRGLGEPGYDPAEDIRFAESQAHFLLVTMRVADPVQEEVLTALRKIRARHPGWPVIVAQTALHALYPQGAGHPSGYPYSGTDADDTSARIHADVRRGLKHQRALFDGLKGAPPIFVPLDFTLPEDGYPPSAFGLEALKDALEHAGVHVLAEIEASRSDEVADEIASRAHPLILAYAAATAASGAAPIPVVGVGGLVTSTGLMLRALARRYGLNWNRARLSEFAAALGLGAMFGFAARYGLRELLKLAPVAGAVTGGALNAISASAFVYAIGRAACRYLGEIRKGEAVQKAEIRRVFKTALDEALRRSRSKSRAVPE